MKITVRVAQVGDLDELVETLDGSFRPRDGFLRWLHPVLRLGLREDLRQRLRSSVVVSSLFLVAVLDSGDGTSRPWQVVGTIELSLQPSPFSFHDVPYPYLSNLAVQPRYRRQGIAQQLLAVCEEIAIDQGYKTLHLHVLEKNTPAKRLYFKAGYRVQKRDSNGWCWLFRRPSRFLMQKHLNNL